MMSAKMAPQGSIGMYSLKAAAVESNEEREEREWQSELRWNVMSQKNNFKKITNG